MAAQRPRKGFGIGDRSQTPRSRARTHRLRKLKSGAGNPTEICAFGGLAEEPAQHRIGPGEPEVRDQPAPLMDVFPGEEQEILLEDTLNVPVAEALPNGPAMFVIDHAGGLIQHLPAALPSQKSKIGIFQVERRQQFVEPSQLEKLPAIEGARSSAPVEARKQLVDVRFHSMPHLKPALLPPAFRQTGLFADFIRVGEKDLAGDRKGVFILEAGQQRRQEIAFHPHVAVEQHHDVVLGGSKSGVGAASEAQVVRQREHLYLRKTLPDELSAAVLGAVVHHDDFVRMLILGGGDHRGQILLDQIPAVPVGNDNRSCGGCRFCACRQWNPSAQAMRSHPQAASRERPSPGIRGPQAPAASLSGCARLPPRSASCRFHPSRFAVQVPSCARA